MTPPGQPYEMQLPNDMTAINASVKLGIDCNNAVISAAKQRVREICTGRFLAQIRQRHPEMSIAEVNRHVQSTIATINTLLEENRI